jgi:uncharacterized protein YkwD
MTRINTCLTLLCSGAFCWSLVQANQGASPTFSQTSNELQLFELTNLERKKKDLPPLKLSPILSKIARAHSENMARQGKMEHKLDGKGPLDRLRDADYKFVKGGENLASGNEDATLPLIMRAWMESKGHRENILLAEYSEIGVGIGRDKNGELFYTQLFARPRKDD